MRKAFPGTITPGAGERRKPARDARAGLCGTRGPAGIEGRTVHRAYPHRPRPGLQPTPPGARAWQWKERESQERGSHAVNSCCLFPGTDVCSQEAVQGRLRTVSSLLLTRMLPHPAGLVARPAPRSSREAQQRQGSSPRALPLLTRDFCLLTFGGTSGRGD